MIQYMRAFLLLPFGGSLDRVGQSRERAVASLGSESCPGRKGASSRLDRRIDRAFVPGGHVGELPAVPVDRAAYLEAVPARHAPAVDVVIDGHGHALDLDRLGAARTDAHPANLGACPTHVDPLSGATIISPPRGGAVW